MAFKPKPKEEEKKPVVDDFYLPPDRTTLQDMYATYSKMKPVIVNNILVVAEQRFLNAKRVLSWNPQYGFSIFDDGTDEWKQKYMRAKNDWKEYQKYEIQREIAIKKSLKNNEK